MRPAVTRGFHYDSEIMKLFRERASSSGLAERISITKQVRIQTLERRRASLHTATAGQLYRPRSRCQDSLSFPCNGPFTGAGREHGCLALSASLASPCSHVDDRMDGGWKRMPVTYAELSCSQVLRPSTATPLTTGQSWPVGWAHRVRARSREYNLPCPGRANPWDGQVGEALG